LFLIPTLVALGWFPYKGRLLMVAKGKIKNDNYEHNQNDSRRTTTKLFRGNLIK
jgi:hypothetical protein